MQRLGISDAVQQLNVIHVAGTKGKVGMVDLPTWLVQGPPAIATANSRLSAPHQLEVQYCSSSLCWSTQAWSSSA